MLDLWTLTSNAGTAANAFVISNIPRAGTFALRQSPSASEGTEQGAGQVSESTYAEIAPITRGGAARSASVFPSVEPVWHPEVRQALEGLSPAVQEQARRVLSSAEWLTTAIHVGRPHVRVTDDGALKLEWLRRDRSLGIFFEEREADSGWCFDSLPSAGGKALWGRLDDLTPRTLFAILTA